MLLDDVLYASEPLENACKLDEQACEALTELASKTLKRGRRDKKLKASDNPDHVVRSLRFGGAPRILYTYRDDIRDEHNEHVPIVLAYDPNHDLDSLFLKDYSYFKDYFEKNTKKLQAELAKKIASRKSGPSQVVKAERLTVIGCKTIVLDEFQASIRAPALIEGAPGTGKTTVGFNILEKFMGEAHSNKTAIYIAQSERLVEHIKQSLMNSPDYSEYIKSNRLKVMTYEQLMAEQYPDLKIEKNAQRDVTDWLKKTVLNHNPERAQEFYLEFRIICGFADPKEYLEVSKNFTNISKERRGEILEAYLKWKKECAAQNRFYLEFHPMSGNAQKYDLMVIDEIQDFSYLQASSLINLGIIPGPGELPNIAMCGDPKQNLVDNAGMMEFLASLFGYSPQLKRVVLRESYRCLPKVMRVADVVNRMRLKLVVKGKQEAPISFKEIHDEKDEKYGSAIWLDPRLAADKKSLEALKQDASVYIIADKDDCKKLSDEGYLWVLTVEEAKGLEKENVVVYEPFKHEQYFAVERALKLLNSGAALDNEANLALGPRLSKIFTMITRAKDKIMFYQSPAESLGTLIGEVKRYCQDKSESKEAIVSDLDTSVKEAKKIFDGGEPEQIERARIILSKLYENNASKVKETMRQWGYIEKEETPLQKHEKVLMEAVSSADKGKVIPYLTNPLTKRLFESNNGPNIIKQVIIVLLKESENGTYSDAAKKHALALIKSLKNNLTACSEFDKEILVLLRESDLLHEWIALDDYDIDKTYLYFKSIDWGSEFLSLIWSYFASLDDNQLKGKLLLKYTKIIRMLSDDSAVLKAIVHEMVYRLGQNVKVNKVSSAFIDDQIKLFIENKYLDFVFDRAIRMGDEITNDDGVSYRKFITEMAVHFGPTAQNLSAVNGDEEFNRDVLLQNIRILNRGYIVEWIESDSFLKTLVKNLRILSYLSVYMHFSGDLSIYELVCEKLDSIENKSIKNYLVKQIHLSVLKCKMIYPTKDIESLMSKILSFYGPNIVFDSGTDTLIINYSKMSGRLGDILLHPYMDILKLFDNFRKAKLDSMLFLLTYEFIFDLANTDNTETDLRIAAYFEATKKTDNILKVCVDSIVRNYRSNHEYNHLSLAFSMGLIKGASDKGMPNADEIFKKYNQPCTNKLAKFSRKTKLLSWRQSLATLSSPNAENSPFYEKNLKIFFELTLSNPETAVDCVSELIDAAPSFVDWNYQSCEGEKTALITLCSTIGVDLSDKVEKLLKIDEVDIYLVDKTGLSAFAHAVCRVSDHNIRTIQLIAQSSNFCLLDIFRSIPPRFLELFATKFFSSVKCCQLIETSHLEEILADDMLREKFRQSKHIKRFEAKASSNSELIICSIANKDIEAIKHWSFDKSLVDHLWEDEPRLLLTNLNEIYSLLVKAESPHIDFLLEVVLMSYHNSAAAHFIPDSRSRLDSFAAFSKLYFSHLYRESLPQLIALLESFLETVDPDLAIIGQFHHELSCYEQTSVLEPCERYKLLIAIGNLILSYSKSEGLVMSTRLSYANAARLSFMRAFELGAEQDDKTSAKTLGLQAESQMRWISGIMFDLEVSNFDRLRVSKSKIPHERVCDFNATFYNPCLSVDKWVGLIIRNSQLIMPDFIDPKTGDSLLIRLVKTDYSDRNGRAIRELILHYQCTRYIINKDGHNALSIAAIKRYPDDCIKKIMESDFNKSRLFSLRSACRPLSAEKLIMVLDKILNSRLLVEVLKENPENVEYLVKGDFPTEVRASILHHLDKFGNASDSNKNRSELNNGAVA